MYTSYYYKYSLEYSIYFVSSFILSLYGMSYVITNAPGDSTILSRRYDIQFDCLDIFIHDNKHI